MNHQPPKTNRSNPQSGKLEPGLNRLFLEWFRIGATSFGGGASVLHMLDTNFVQRRGWISAADNTRLFAICQLAPGINLLAMCPGQPQSHDLSNLKT